MAVADLILDLRYAKYGITPTSLPGAVQATLRPNFSTVKRSVIDGGATIHHRGVLLSITGTITFENYNSAEIAVGLATGNLVFGYRGPASANEKATLKNAVVHDFGDVPIGTVEEGNAPGRFTVPFECDVGSADTLALMLVFATDP